MNHFQQKLPYQLITPDYIPFHPHESLAAYSKRFAALLLFEKKIEHDQPLFIAGHSLGSAIGIELTKHLPVRGIILIGGLMSSGEIKPFPRLFGKYIGGWLPLWVYRAGQIFIGPVMSIVSGLEPSEIALSRKMYRDLSPGFFRDAYRAIVRWPGSLLSIPFLRIHGEHDHRIECPMPGSNTIIIPNAKHMVGQSHPEVVNHAIKSFITSVATGNK